jgi:hypothetical protein
MSDPREKVYHGLLLDALGDPVDLNSVDWHVRQQNPSATRLEGYGLAENSPEW